MGRFCERNKQFLLIHKFINDYTNLHLVELNLISKECNTNFKERNILEQNIFTSMSQLNNTIVGGLFTSSIKTYLIIY